MNRYPYPHLNSDGKTYWWVPLHEIPAGICRSTADYVVTGIRRSSRYFADSGFNRYITSGRHDKPKEGELILAAWVHDVDMIAHELKSVGSPADQYIIDDPYVTIDRMTLSSGDTVHNNFPHQSAEWSRQLREKVEASAERERTQVLCDPEFWDWE